MDTRFYISLGWRLTVLPNRHFLFPLTTWKNCFNPYF